MIEVTCTVSSGRRSCRRPCRWRCRPLLPLILPLFAAAVPAAAADARPLRWAVFSFPFQRDSGSDSDSAQGQVQGRCAGTEVGVRGEDMITSGSFGLRNSRWAADVNREREWERERGRERKKERSDVTGR
jgi:hypothetical protein